MEERGAKRARRPWIGEHLGQGVARSIGWQDPCSASVERSFKGKSRKIFPTHKDCQGDLCA